MWNSQTWNADTAHSLLLNVQRSKGQTNEARDHAGLILSWMELRKNMGMSRKSRLHRQAQAEAHESSGNDDKNDVVVPLPLKLGKANSTAVPDFAPDGKLIAPEEIIILTCCQSIFSILRFVVGCKNSPSRMILRKAEV